MSLDDVMFSLEKKPRCNCVFMYCKFTYSFFYSFSSQYQRMGLLRTSAVPTIFLMGVCMCVFLI